MVRTIPQLNAMVVRASAATKGRLAADRRSAGVATDRLTSPDVVERAKPDLSAPGLRGAQRVPAAAAPAAARAAGINPDPAWDYKGLLWDYRRMGLPQGWKTTAGSPAVTVGVADTGLDFTHAELASKVVQVVDLTVLEGDEPICKTLFGQSDDDLAAQFGGPATTDWNGHGSWIGGNIAAALNGTGTNGIAPKVKLVALKISQWCGFSSTAAELASFVTAADMGIDVVNISFGGYSDPADPESAVAFQAYADAIAYARSKGTLIVGSAGNAHVRIGADGRVTSHGQLTTPGTTAEDFVDLFGYYRVPTGPPGALVVSATGNLVNAPSATCPPGTEGSADDPDATCKPASDAHQPFGVGQRDQLAYYSNYGARVDVAAPGGARKFNLGAYDRGRGPDRQRPPVAAAPAGGAGGPGSRRPPARCGTSPRRCRPPTPRPATSPACPATPASATWAGRRSPTATPTGPASRTWPTPDARPARAGAQSARAWLWRTRSTMLSRARGENGLVK